MSKDQALQEKSLEWILHADKFNYIYNFTGCQYTNGRSKGMEFCLPWFYLNRLILDGHDDSY